MYLFLEWFYHTAITANNLAAFYEKYGIVKFLNLSDKDEKNKVIAKARCYYEISYKRRPNVKAACSLGYLAFQKEKYKAALYYYQRALQIKKRPELYYNLAVLHIYLKQYDRAIRYIRKALPTIKKVYQQQACKSLIYVYAMGGYRHLAREHFQRYIDIYKEADVELMYIAYACQEYGYIDKNCLSLAGEGKLDIRDIEIVLHTLYLVGKEKLGIYFLDKCMAHPYSVGKEDWIKLCNSVLEKVKRKEYLEYISDFHTELILHKKMFY